ncbi:aminoacyl-tRNA hydrolase [Spiroplasma endosymbiont of Crioceris asparagi]|uniref:aminoacyl-tRNA hydrolase n=1 Tax=Spiroplasma endosymbiont of Crioceris asparagi TaxID=3066286 RepID=UPI0030CCFCA6
MKLIVGLGNPGKSYEKTRHNMGFMVIDMLLKDFGFIKKEDSFKGELYFSKVNGEKCIFLKPQTFMNLSGECVVKVMHYYKINIEDLLVIYDDKDLEFSKVRFKNQGSSGGQNGIKNVILNLGTDAFNRLRIGIGQQKEHYTIIEWVMSKINEVEMQQLINSYSKFKKGIEDFIKGNSFLKIMNDFN